MDLLVILKDNLVPFLVVLTVLVFVHEMGHFLVARWNGVRVLVFSVGFGPELFGRTDRSGTRWRFSAIPLGGYVKMFGDADASSGRAVEDTEMSDEDRALSFHHKSLRQRTAIIAAGPAANYLFALVVLTGLYAIGGQELTTSHVDGILPGSAAAEAGFEIGDRIVEVDGAEIARFDELQRIVSANPGVPLPIVLERDGRMVELMATPRPIVISSDATGDVTIGRLGIRSKQTRLVRHDLLSATGQAFGQAWWVTHQTIVAVGEMIIGSRSTEDLSGPLRIAQMSGMAVELGWYKAIWFVAVLSVSLGLINLFPIPLLDGGHLVFYALEAVRGRPVGERLQLWTSLAGMAAVVGLMLFVTWNDLVHMRVFEFFGTLFS